MGDVVLTSTDRELSPTAQMHLWVVTFHLVQLFKWLLPKEDNHVTMALVASTLSDVLSGVDSDYYWSSWVDEINDAQT